MCKALSIFSFKWYIFLFLIAISCNPQIDYKDESTNDNGWEYEKYLPILQSLRLTQINTSTGLPDDNYKTLVFAALADIHNNYNAAVKCFSFIRSFSDYLDDYIGLGDYQHVSLADPLSLNQIQGWTEMIKIIGNHDAYDNWPLHTTVPDSVCFNTFMEDDIKKWNVSFSSNKCYFYKDYDMAKIRAVFIDYMHWGEAQEKWLKNVLIDFNDSALNKKYHVIICVHSFPQSNLSGSLVQFSNCSFTCLDRPIVSDFSTSIPDIVDSFQNLGGYFVCYICGHHHINISGVYENYPNQIVLVQPCVSLKDWSDTVHSLNTVFDVQFNLYSFDSQKQYIRVYRVGAPYNRNLQHMESMLLQYGEKVKLLNCY